MGSKIKTLAKVESWLGIITSILVGLFIFGNQEDPATGILVMILGPLFFWILSFVLYGFGELIL